MQMCLGKVQILFITADLEMLSQVIALRLKEKRV